MENLSDIKVGQKYLVNKGFSASKYDRVNGSDHISSVKLVAGSIIEFMGVFNIKYPNGHISNDVVFKNIKNGNEFQVYSEFTLSKIEPYNDGQIVPDFKGAVGYKIKYKGDFFKPKKFKDMSQIKSSLLIAFGYYDKLRSNANYNRNPELYLMDIPYWFEGREIISLEEFKNVEIVEVQGRNITPYDFNAYEYIKESNLKLKAICEYGYVVKELFTKTKDESDFKYYITYTPDEYDALRSGGYYSYHIEDKIKDMKENQIIKDTIKKLNLKSKDIKKVTKYGKTAIAVKTEEHLFGLMDLFPVKNIDVFTFDSENIREYNKEAKRKFIINNI